jgi:monothiol glutaredoxin
MERHRRGPLRAARPGQGHFESHADSHDEKGLRSMSEQAVHDWIRKVVANHDVVLFMKGNSAGPQCGFSAQVVQILSHLGVSFKDVNVLEDMSIREGIKSFSNWPTIPQLYVKGEFVGGCDIVTEMTLSGELDELFAAKGIAFDREAADKIREANR